MRRALIILCLTYIHSKKFNLCGDDVDRRLQRLNKSTFIPMAQKRNKTFLIFEHKKAT